MTELRWTAAAWAPRCTVATVANLTGEVPATIPLTGTAVLSALMDAGYTYRDIEEWGPTRGNGGWKHRTVKSFVEAHPTGKYYLVTDGHAMAVVDGLLVDTAGEGPNRRWIRAVYEVYPA